MKEYQIELDISEGNAGEFHIVGSYPDFAKEGVFAWMYGRLDKGQKFLYPDNHGQLCPWRVDSLTGMIRVLEFGGTLTWGYRGTPYEKAMIPDDMTSEFVRYPDPTASVVIIDTRTALTELNI